MDATRAVRTRSEVTHAPPSMSSTSVVVIFGRFSKGLFTQIANCGDIFRPPPRVFITSHSISQCGGELFAMSQSFGIPSSSIPSLRSKLIFSVPLLHYTRAQRSLWPHMKNPHLPSSFPSVPLSLPPSICPYYVRRSQPACHPYLFPFSPSGSLHSALPVHCSVYTADSR